jgi:ATP-dependent DNA ligase
MLAWPASTASATGRHDASVFLYAFDLIELNGDDLRRYPLEVRRGYAALLVWESNPLIGWLCGDMVKARSTPIASAA